MSVSKQSIKRYKINIYFSVENLFLDLIHTVILECFTGKKILEVQILEPQSPALYIVIV